ncbi:MAG: asparaginase [Oscillospiraceae bacterium]|nr:asparaginase [Oscillospiraceae bacterium]
MKKILMINTGGTFSSRPGPHGLTPQMSSEEILGHLGKGSTDVQLDLEDYCSLDSANIRPEDWCRLSLRIGEVIAVYDGVVLIHGTDTLAYTASMLSFMLQNPPIPIVLTGSQLPLGAPMSDAADNCLCAIEMASSGMGGVFVAFNRKIMLGCRTSKVRTISFNAFESINYPNVGEFNAFGLQLNIRHDFVSPFFRIQTDYSDRIAVLKLFPGMDPDIFRFLQEHGYEGIYIEGFGLGGVPFLKGDFTAEIRRASEAGLPILVGSQCRYEGSNLRIYETGQRILECGGIPVHNMTQEAVVTKLMWCLGQTKKREDILRLFQQNLVQEVSFL